MSAVAESNSHAFTRPADQRPVLIYESALDGHRVRYLGYLLAHLAAAGRRTVVVLPADGADTAEFKDYLARFRPAAEFLFSIPPHPSSGWRNLSIRRRYLKAALVRIGPAQVIIPTADQLAQSLWMLRFSWWRPVIRNSTYDVVLLRLRWGLPAKGMAERLKRLASFAALWASPCRRIWSIDERPVRYAASSPVWRQRLGYLPDPIELPPPQETPAARTALGLLGDGLLVGSVGLMDERKGADLLVRSFVRIASRTTARLILAGRASPGVQPVIEHALAEPALKGRIFWVDRFVSEAELHAFISALDLICLPYVEHQGLSSFLLRAAAARKPILGSEAGWIGDTITRHQLGWTCDPRNPDDLANQLLAAIESIQKKEFQPGDSLWLAAHDAAHFAGTLTGISLKDDGMTAILPPR